MIQFYSADNLLQDPEQLKEVDAQVRRLQQVFGDRHCNDHPNYQWAVGIRWCSRHHQYVCEMVNSGAGHPCNFLKELLDKEVNIYLAYSYDTM